MKDIVKIVIKGTSGYCRIDEAYKDKVTITPESINYEYVPAVETEMNPKRKWSYKTNSSIFKMKYDTLVALMSGVTERGVDVFRTDIGGIEFVITYADKTKFDETFWVPSDYFESQFKVIKEMVPECEYTPAVLLTSEDSKRMFNPGLKIGQILKRIL